jgi:hypothetical protein
MPGAGGLDGVVERVEELRLEWPSGLVERWRNLAVNQFVALVEGMQ